MLKYFFFHFCSRPSSDSSRTSARTSTTTTPPTTAASTTVPSAATPETPNNSAVPVVTPSAPKKNDNGQKGDVSKVLLSELQSFLSGLKTSDGAGGSSNGRTVDLSTAVNAETVTFLTDAERTENLLAHLPNIDSNDNAKQQLRDTISSPQFQQALSMFSSALQSGQLGPVVSQFQLNDEAVAAATNGDLEQFVKALEKNAKEIVAKATEKEQEKKEDTAMEEDKNGST